MAFLFICGVAVACLLFTAFVALNERIAEAYVN